MDILLPPYDVNLTADAQPSVDYYNFFEDVQNAISLTADADSIDSLDKRVTALEDDEGSDIKVLGGMSINVQQPNELTGGWTVTLVADSQYPGNTKFYGTGGTGTKGFHAVSDALAVTTNMTKTVGSDGVSTFDLADVTLTTGGALKKYGFDAKGRLAKSDDATTDDLTEGDDNLYFTADRARAAAVDNAITPGVTDKAPSEDAVAKALANVAAGVPYFIPDGESYTVPTNIQALWALPIELEGDATITINGELVGVN